MTANDEIVKSAYEINQELGIIGNESDVRIPTSNSTSGPIIDESEAEIIEESPVYVEKSSIKDILELNEVNKKIEEKRTERDNKEAEINKLEEDRKELSDSIGIINTGDGEHVQESLNKLQALRQLDLSISSEKDAKENIYKALTELENKGEDLNARARNMIAKMTADYNEKASEYALAVDEYIKNRSVNDYNRAQNLAKELSNYKKYETFDAILKDEEVTKKEEDNVKDESVAKVTELNEVKVDHIDDPEVVKNNPFAGTSADFEFPSETLKKEQAKPVEINPYAGTPADFEFPSDTIKKEEEAENAKVVETPVAPEAPVESTSAPVVPEEPKVSFDDIASEKKPENEVLLNKGSKIADSTKEGVLSTIDTFNPISNNAENTDPTLTLKN